MQLIFNQRKRILLPSDTSPLHSLSLSRPHSLSPSLSPTSSLSLSLSLFLSQSHRFIFGEMISYRWNHLSNSVLFDCKDSVCGSGMHSSKSLHSNEEISKNLGQGNFSGFRFSNLLHFENFQIWQYSGNLIYRICELTG